MSRDKPHVLPLRKRDVWRRNVSFLGWMARSSCGADPCVRPPRKHSRAKDTPVYDLIRLLTIALKSGSSSSLPDHESGARIDRIDGANLTEMDCCWSPTMGQPLPSFEEIHPRVQRQGPESRA